MFGDDDDLWHHSRVREIIKAIKAYPKLDGVAASRQQLVPQ